MYVLVRTWLSVPTRVVCNGTWSCVQGLGARSTMHRSLFIHSSFESCLLSKSRLKSSAPSEPVHPPLTASFSDGFCVAADASAPCGGLLPRAGLPAQGLRVLVSPPAVETTPYAGKFAMQDSSKTENASEDNAMSVSIDVHSCSQWRTV